MVCQRDVRHNCRRFSTVCRAGRCPFWGPGVARFGRSEEEKARVRKIRQSFFQGTGGHDVCWARLGVHYPSEFPCCESAGVPFTEDGQGGVPAEVLRPWVFINVSLGLLLWHGRALRCYLSGYCLTEEELVEVWAHTIVDGERRRLLSISCAIATSLSSCGC